MQLTYKILRALLMTVIAVAVFVPVTLYVLLSTEWASERIKAIGEAELSRLLGTEVIIGQLKVQPFNTIMIKNVEIKDDFDKTALLAADIEARFEFWHFVTTGHLAFDYAKLDSVEINLYRESKSAPLNIARIIEHLKSDDKEKPPTAFDLSLYTVRLENTKLNYNILDEPVKNNTFDINHIRLSDLSLYATAPELSNNRIGVKIRRLSFAEQSGFKLANLTASISYTPKRLECDDLRILLDRSRLLLGDYVFSYDSPDELSQLFTIRPLDVKLQKGSYVTLSDVGYFVPKLADVDSRFNIEAHASVSKDNVHLHHLQIADSDDLIELSALGEVSSYNDVKLLNVNDFKLNGRFAWSRVDQLLAKLKIDLSPKIREIANAAANVRFDVEAHGRVADMALNADVETGLGNISVAGSLTDRNDFKDVELDATVTIDELDLNTITGLEKFGRLSTSADVALALKDGKPVTCDLNIGETSLQYNGHDVRQLTVAFRLLDDRSFTGNLDALFDAGSIAANFHGNSVSEHPSLVAGVDVRNIVPQHLGILNNYPDYVLNVGVDVDLSGVPGRWVDGFVDVRNLTFQNPDASKAALNVRRFKVSADNTSRPNIIEIESDFLNGTFEGDISLWSIVPQTRRILAAILPSFVTPAPPTFIPADQPRYEAHDNNFHFNLEIDNAENLATFFNLPVAVIYPVAVDGEMNAVTGRLDLGIDAPYLMKGDMIIEKTGVQAILNADSREGRVFLTTQFPTKKGPMSIVGGILARDDVMSTEINWAIEREKPINGNLLFDTRLGRTDDGKLTAQVDFMPGEIHFGNDTWTFNRSTVNYGPEFISFKNFGLSTTGQAIRINGFCRAGDPMSDVRVDLDHVVLNTIFETLDINKALIGGIATGSLHAGGIFDRQPYVTSNDLHVTNIGYNNCVLGDGDILAKWDSDKQSFYLDATISQPDGRKSYIKGDIFPAKESLDLHFDADHIKVGFMKPFMDAFAADVTGYASGKAHLFGTFKYIDMEGDVYAEDLGLKVGFTNTWYYATDSIHIVPGLIDIKNVTVRDVDGNTALLNGFVKHTFFKDPVFDFRITDARNFLCYDVTPKLSPDWYGKIYGNGVAYITGHPGVVNIDVNMSTAENSTFTFVLSDAEEAEQYNFITFRDKNRGIVTDSIINKEILPPAVIAYRDRMLQLAQQQNPPSTYNMNIQMDVTPAAKVIIVMDPVGGDEIKSWGRGNLRMTYTSIGNELRMYGSYVIDRGSYNFTLQDIIVKDFTIRPGSFISFTGDPYNASLDIGATYLVNANLSDLDESFVNDPELNRTNVPVHAVLLVKGDMRQPDIDFDLEFPTLTTNDVYRKVRSIISTDEMMNRQMIYLLALNRFYTPEYMSTTKGNELFSVASSTISSRLSSMLGKLSENWSISPNLRSDKGDFSDVQFDVALSSNLLNNRLRMNGNFGYRDKSLNTTQFIGDFDLEYLLTRSGTWRLKAYNRFNDQTYFLRTAKTTQGVGIMFSREFDNWFSFLRRRKKSASDDKTIIDPVGEEKIVVDGVMPADTTGIGSYPLSN